MAETIRSGGCACGRLSFKARGEPDRVGVCHCMTCRKTSGSTFNAFAVFTEDRVTIKGPYEAWASSKEAKRCFCPACGSQVFALGASEVEVRIGAFDGPNTVEPTYEAWISRRERWLRMTGMEQYPRNRGEEA